jgi:hypothetical protein
MDHLARALNELKSRGVLLLQDPELPSLATLIAGERIRGSWWAHPKGKIIFDVANELEDSGDVLIAKLLGKKVTFVHRALFPAVVAIGKSRDDWQLGDLTPAARRLLRRVDDDGSLRTSGRDAKQLEERLLVHAQQVHTDSGKHELELSTWAGFQKRQKLGRLPTARSAKQALETVVAKLANDRAPDRLLPWSSGRD